MKVLVFGVFDMLHPGHIYFIEQSQKIGGILYICLANDEYVKDIKNKIPYNNFDQRKKMILNSFPKVIVLQGDSKIGQWSVFKNLIPDFIVVGYDQFALKDALNYLPFLKNTKIIQINPYFPEKYNTTKLQNLN